MTTATTLPDAVSVVMLEFAHDQALAEARKASKAFADQHFGGDDGGACGFAWVNIRGKVRSNSRLGKALATIGFDKNYTGALQLWNGRDGWYFGQSVDAAEAGAQAYARKFEELTGLPVIAGSRLD